MTTVITTKFASLEVRKQVVAKLIKQGYTAPSNYPALPAETMHVILDDNALGQHTYRYASWCSSYEQSIAPEEFLK